jgi:hypothetical protein
MRDIRQDRQAYRQMEQKAAPTLQNHFKQATAPTKAAQTAKAEAKSRQPSHAERLQALRAGRQPKPANRGQDREPER